MASTSGGEQRQDPGVVLVTEPEYRKAQVVFAAASGLHPPCLPAPSDEAELARAVRAQGARAVIVGTAMYRGPLYDALAPGSVLARFGVGYDGIDLAQATAKGLLCTNTPGVLDASVAEHALALMLAAARQVPSLDRCLRGGSWVPKVGCELRGRTLAIIGCGAIGTRLATIAGQGLGMRVVGCDTKLPEPALQAAAGFAAMTADFREAVGDADFVSLHIPSRPATRHFINRSRLDMMKPGAWLINTARGPVVDEAALYDALSTGHLGGAALDVFEREPYEPIVPGKDLRTLGRTVLTPHVGSSTLEACHRMAERALHNIELALRGDYGRMDLIHPAIWPDPAHALTGITT